VDDGRWHVDVLAATPPGQGGWLVRPDGGDAAWPVWEMAPEALLAALNEVALAEPRTTVVAGSLGAGRITYMTRSRLWGFPDFTTVQAVPLQGGATLALLARLRFGGSDLGVNRARVERWNGAVRRALPAPQAG